MFFVSKKKRVWCSAESLKDSLTFQGLRQDPALGYVVYIHLNFSWMPRGWPKSNVLWVTSNFIYFWAKKWKNEPKFERRAWTAIQFFGSCLRCSHYFQNTKIRFSDNCLKNVQLLCHGKIPSGTKLSVVPRTFGSIFSFQHASRRRPAHPCDIIRPNVPELLFSMSW